MNKKTQPISPHLTIYKPQITSIMSISHRISGFFQSIGTIIIFTYILFILAGESYYDFIDIFFSNFVGKLFLLFYSLSISYHFCNGIRHLIWDLGYGFDIKNVYFSAYVTIFCTIIMSTLIWVI
ncbi:MAG: succinate dehydrogenase, cytochrome b556 subunit [Rickettsiales bacterium]|nr:succinate dehydrogenase, cytochrome b556 subunit [Rickettsiales bacterium]OUV80850.1 MAG: succinate dehydrogenase, cytochrome b556 subunit [Rickettsiales bacterium TMED131]